MMSVCVARFTAESHTQHRGEGDRITAGETPPLLSTYYVQTVCGSALNLLQKSEKNELPVSNDLARAVQCSLHVRQQVRHAHI
jgi:hypothetical protein